MKPNESFHCQRLQAGVDTLYTAIRLRGYISNDTILELLHPLVSASTHIACEAIDPKPPKGDDMKTVAEFTFNTPAGADEEAS